MKTGQFAPALRHVEWAFTQNGTFVPWRTCDSAPDAHVALPLSGAAVTGLSHPVAWWGFGDAAAAGEVWLPHAVVLVPPFPGPPDAPVVVPPAPDAGDPAIAPEPPPALVPSPAEPPAAVPPELVGAPPRPAEPETPAPEPPAGAAGPAPPSHASADAATKAIAHAALTTSLRVRGVGAGPRAPRS
jgi:hypothetical protein